MATKGRGPDGLTSFEREICQAVDRGLSDREAYRAVRPQAKANDVSAANYVWRVRHRPHCIAYLKALQARSLASHMNRKDRIIEELACVAFSDIGDLVEWSPEGPKVKPLDKLLPAPRRAVARLSVGAKGGTFRIALHDKLPALEKLCRLFGLYDRPDDIGHDVVAQLSDVERAQRLAAILQLADTGDAMDDEAAADTAGR